MFHFLEDETTIAGCRVNHSKDPARIAINLNQFQMAMMDTKQRPLDLVQVRRELRQSKRYPFLEYEAVYSSITNKTTKCFIFTNKAGDALKLAA